MAAPLTRSFRMPSRLAVIVWPPGVVKTSWARVTGQVVDAATSTSRTDAMAADGCFIVRRGAWLVLCVGGCASRDYRVGASTACWRRVSANARVARAYVASTRKKRQQQPFRKPRRIDI